MRILHLAPYYAPAYAFGGVVRSVEGMARALARRGHAVTVLTTDALSLDARCDEPPDEWRDGVRVVRAPNLFPRLRRWANLSTPNRMKRLAESLLPQVDIVHCHEFRTVENLLVTPAARRLGRPLVLSPHGTLTYATGRGTAKALWDRLFGAAVALRFDQIIGLTDAEVEEARALWSAFGGQRMPAGFSVVPNGIDPEEYANLAGGADFRARWGLGDAPVCLFLGRLHPRKGADVLARAFLAADVQEARLVIAGPDEGARPLLAALADPRIVLTGYLDGDDRLAALAAADVLALPAVGEGLPMAALEALAAGLPVILSPGCNLPEAAAAGAGLIVEPQPEPLAAALQALLTDPGRRAQMGAAARALARARFTWDAAASRLEAVYAALLTLNAAPARA